MRMTRQEYLAYIHSSEWREIAQEVRERENFVCQICGERGWQVHHISYDHLGHERDNDLNDLACLCDNCHENTTEWVKSTRQKRLPTYMELAEFSINCFIHNTGGKR